MKDYSLPSLCESSHKDGGGGRNPAGLVFASGVVTKGNGDCFLTEEQHTSLTSGGGQAGQGYPCVLTAAFSPKPSAKARSIGYEKECSPTLTSNTPAVICLNDQGGQRMDVYENQSGTLRAQMDGHPPLVMATQQGGAEICEDFLIQPTNISVLSSESLSARIYALMNVLKGEVEMLCLDSRESFENIKRYLRQRIVKEDIPEVRSLLEQEGRHLDRIQVQMATTREFLIIVRLKDQKKQEVFPYLSRIEKMLGEQGFKVRRADKEDIKRILAVYFAQNVTTEHFEDFDGERWITVMEQEEKSQKEKQRRPPRLAKSGGLQHRWSPRVYQAAVQHPDPRLSVQRGEYRLQILYGLPPTGAERVRSDPLPAARRVPLQMRK